MLVEIFFNFLNAALSQNIRCELLFLILKQERIRDVTLLNQMAESYNDLINQSLQRTEHSANAIAMSA